MKKILSILLLGALLLLCFSGCATLGDTNDGDNSTDDVNDNVNNVVIFLNQKKLMKELNLSSKVFIVSK